VVTYENYLKKSHKLPLLKTLEIMYRNKLRHSLLDVALPAALGAGIVTSFAISQGQHPAIALVITAIATGLAVVCRVFDLV
jgi:hypothetical protein